jgi:alpha-glucosidase
MPWDPEVWDSRFLDQYRRLIRIRNDSPALCRGGFRWVHTAPDAVVFLRESPGQRLLIRAARAATAPLELSTALLRAESLVGIIDADDLTPAAGTVIVPGDGPTLSIWQLS